MLGIEVANSSPHWRLNPLQWVLATYAILIAAFFLWNATLSPILFNPMSMGQIALLIAFGLAVERLWLLIPLMVPSIVFSDSRGVWLSLAIGLATLSIRKPLFLLIIALALSVAITIYVGPSDLERLRIWSAAYSHLTIFGNGLGSFNNLYISQGTAVIHPIHVHNDFLELAFEFGIFAIPFYAIAIVAFLTPNAAWWPVAVVFLFMSCFSFPLYNPLSAIVGLYAIGACLWDRY